MEKEIQEEIKKDDEKESFGEGVIRGLGFGFLGALGTLFGLKKIVE